MVCATNSRIRSEKVGLPKNHHSSPEWLTQISLERVAGFLLLALAQPRSAPIPSDEYGARQGLVRVQDNPSVDIVIYRTLLIKRSSHRIENLRMKTMALQYEKDQPPYLHSAMRPTHSPFPVYSSSISLPPSNS